MANTGSPRMTIPRGAVPRYDLLADELVTMIGAGQLRTGDRVPSVRVLARQRRVSPSTAVAALRALERRGVVEARPQSGFFVLPRTPRSPPPAITRPPRSARDVRVNALVNLLNAASLDRSVVPLGSALPEPSWFPGRSLQRVLARSARRVPALTVDYPALPGLLALRQQIARHYAGIGCLLEADELLITNGCMDALNLCLGAVAGPGDTVAVESPTWFGFLQVIESLGLRALEIRTDPRTGLSVEAFEQALTSRADPRIRACLLSTTFSNPLGASLPEDARRRLLEVCGEHDVALIEDDVYGDLHFGAARPPPMKSFDRHGQVMLCSSFSKTLAPGARIGWVAAGRWSDAVRLRKYTASIATPTLWQDALATYLRGDAWGRHLRRLRRACALQVERFSEAIEDTFPRGTRLSRPQGGFVLWVELPAGADTVKLHARASAEKISFLPGTLFSASGGYGHCLRINCGRTWTPRVAAAVRRLGALASAQ